MSVDIGIDLGTASVLVYVRGTHETKFSKGFFYLFFCQCNLHTRSFLPVEPIGQFLIFSFSYLRRRF